ncbi:unnamed protein product, partial [Phaeothamnion confervicola]
VPVKSNDAVALVAAHAAFATSGVAIDVAARDERHLPQLTIGAGCRVDVPRGRVTVLVNASQSRELLAALARVPSIAVVFGRPSDHRSLQLKGHDACIEALAAGDAELMLAYRDAFTADMVKAGMSHSLSHGYLNIDPADSVAVRFTPYAAFDQTPGPAAGTRIT